MGRLKRSVSAALGLVKGGLRFILVALSYLMGGLIRVLVAISVVFSLVIFPFQCVTQFHVAQQIASIPGNTWGRLTEGGGKRSAYPELRNAPDTDDGWLTPLETIHLYRPVLYFDSGEPWRPLRIGDWLRRSGVELCLPDAECEVVRTTQEFFTSAPALRAWRRGREAELYLDIPGTRTKDYRPEGDDVCRPWTDTPFMCDGAPRSAIYVFWSDTSNGPRRPLEPQDRVTRDDYQIYLDYWWFMPFNDFSGPTGCRFRLLCTDHEGDWEGVTVVLSVKGGVIDGLHEAHYAQHEGKPLYFGRIELRGDDALWSDRPRVYVARGTHAAYTRPCPIPAGEQLVPCIQSLRGVPEAPHDGFESWYMNEDDHCNLQCVVLMNGERWPAWPGFWGYKESGQGRAPRSPGQQARFKDPTAFRD
jgi:hypothetical protein